VSAGALDVSRGDHDRRVGAAGVVQPAIGSERGAPLEFRLGMGAGVFVYIRLDVPLTSCVRPSCRLVRATTRNTLGILSILRDALIRLGHLRLFDTKARMTSAGPGATRRPRRRRHDHACPPGGRRIVELRQAGWDEARVRAGTGCRRHNRWNSDGSMYSN
jgi:hypothetical protein